jgi:hypothetical protein
MPDPHTRILDPSAPPSRAKVAAWLGKDAYACWKRIAGWIDTNYPGVFEPEWLFAGKAHGWAQRYKKSKSLCTFVPEKGRFRILLVFGREEREKFEALRDELLPATCETYDAARVYMDGTWVLLTVDGDAAAADVERLLAMKRRPRPSAPQRSRRS